MTASPIGTNGGDSRTIEEEALPRMEVLYIVSTGQELCIAYDSFNLPGETDERRNRCPEVLWVLLHPGPKIGLAAGSIGWIRALTA